MNNSIINNSNIKASNIQDGNSFAKNTNSFFGKTFLKGLLASSALLISSSQPAFGAALVPVTVDQNLISAAGGGANQVAIAAGDAVQDNNANAATTLTVLAAVLGNNSINAIAGIDINGKNTKIVVGAQDFTLGVVVNSQQPNGDGTKQGLNALAVEFNGNAGKLILNGSNGNPGGAPIANFEQDAGNTAAAQNNYAALGDVNFANNAGTLEISSTGATFFGKIEGKNGTLQVAGAGAGVGTLAITGANNIFTGNIGAKANTALAAISVGDDTTFRPAAAAELGADAITIANAKTLTLDSTTAAIKVNDGGNGTIQGAVAAGDGILKLQGANDITINAFVGTNANGIAGGAGNSLSAVTIQTTANTVTFVNDVKVKGDIDANDAAGNVVFGGDIAAVNLITGTGNTTFANNITAANVTGDITFNGNIVSGGGTKNVEIAAGKTLTVNAKNATGANLTVGTTIDGDGGGGAAELMQINTTGGKDAIFTQKIGNGNKLASITINHAAAAGGDITFNDDVKVAGDINAANAQGDVTFGGNIAAVNLITGTGNTTFNNDIAAANVTGDITFNGNIIGGKNVEVAGGQNLIVNAAAANLNIAASIDGDAVGNGSIKINTTGNNTTFTKTIGNGNKLASITINHAAAAGGDITFNDDVKIAGDINAANAQGDVTFDKTVEVGAGHKVISSQGTTTFTEFSDVAIELSNAASIVVLGDAAAAGANRTKAITTAGGGTVNLAADYTFANTATVGAVGNALTELDLAGNTLTIQGGAIVANIISAGGGGTLIANNANNNITGDIGVNGANLTAITISDGTTLTATNGSVYANVINLNNAAAQFTLANSNGGTINGIATNAGDNKGKFIAELAANKILSFGGDVGTAANKIAEFEVNGAAPGAANPLTSKIVFANAGDKVYAHKVSYSNLKIDATANGLEIDAPTQLDINNIECDLGTKILKVTTPVLNLNGNMAVKFTYNAAVTPLDLTGVAALGGLPAPAPQINITVEGAAPAPNTRMTAIKAPGAVMDILGPLMKVNAGTKWAIDRTVAGGLIYDMQAAVAVAQAAAAKAEETAGASVAEYQAAAEKIKDSLGGNVAGTKNSDGSVTSSFVDKTKFNYDLSTPEGKQKLLDTFATPANTELNLKAGFLARMHDFVISNEENNVPLSITKEDAKAYAIIAKDINQMPDVVASSIIDSDKTGISDDLVEEIISVAANQDDPKVNELSHRIVDTASQVASAVIETANTRTASLVNGPAAAFPTVGGAGAGGAELLQSSNEGAGIAAGSPALERFGLWTSGTVGRENQKKRSGSDGYKSVYDVVTVGADTMINDSTIIGVAGSYALSNIKFKDASSGNKTNSGSWVGTLYGQHQLNNNLFVRGSALLSRSNIKNKNLRVVRGGGYGIANSKYHFMSYGAELNVGTNYALQNNVVLTPTIGARILHTEKVKYNETGNTLQNNKNISQKAQNSYTALAGLGVAYTVMKDSVSYTPEAHANLQYLIGAKASKGSYNSALSPNVTTYFTGAKPSNFNHTYGGSLTVSNGQFDAGIGGDVSFASKYVGYQGSLKLKVRF